MSFHHFKRRMTTFDTRHIVYDNRRKGQAHRDRRRHIDHRRIIFPRHVLHYRAPHCLYRATRVSSIYTHGLPTALRVHLRDHHHTFLWLSALRQPRDSPPSGTLQKIARGPSLRHAHPPGRGTSLVHGPPPPARLGGRHRRRVVYALFHGVVLQPPPQNVHLLHYIFDVGDDHHSALLRFSMDDIHPRLGPHLPRHCGSSRRHGLGMVSHLPQPVWRHALVIGRGAVHPLRLSRLLHIIAPLRRLHLDLFKHILHYVHLNHGVGRPLSVFVRHPPDPLRRPIGVYPPHDKGVRAYILPHELGSPVSLRALGAGRADDQAARRRRRRVWNRDAI